MIVIATLEAQSGKEHEVKAVLQELIPQVQTEAETLSYIFHQAEDDAGKFLFYERYANKAAFDRHLDSPYLKAALTRVVPLLRREPILECYEQLDTISR